MNNIAFLCCFMNLIMTMFTLPQHNQSLAMVVIVYDGKPQQNIYTCELEKRQVSQEFTRAWAIFLAKHLSLLCRIKNLVTLSILNFANPL